MVNFDCKHAYFVDEVDYVLCDKVEKPATTEFKDTAKAMCKHQRFCPEVRKCTLLPTFVSCERLVEKKVEKTKAKAEKKAETEE